MREWDKYIHNNVTCGDCQLVTAVNAYYHLTGKQIKPTHKRYGKLVELSACQHGSAIFIKKAWKRLGLEVTPWRYSPYVEIHGENPQEFPHDTPVEARIWHKAYGCHSVLIVDYVEKCGAIRITNFGKVTSLDGWIFLEDFQHYLKHNGDPHERRLCYRSFFLSKPSFEKAVGKRMKAAKRRSKTIREVTRMDTEKLRKPFTK